jgi:hypothetical protein
MKSYDLVSGVVFAAFFVLFLFGEEAGVPLLSDPSPWLQEAAVPAALVGVGFLIMSHPEEVPNRIEAGPCSRLCPVCIEYDNIDTRGGSSGSGILADATRLILGVHTTGFCCEELPVTNCPENDPLRVNSGVRISGMLNAPPSLRILAAGETPSA